MTDESPARPAPPPEKIRLIHLDLLRGIAILLVLGPHLPIDSPQMSQVLKLWHRGGWCGVDLFFVLSGFLIGGLLFDEHLKTGVINVRRFLIRRGFKIWPSYVVFLLFEFFSLFSQKPGDILHRVNLVFIDMWPNFLHVQNYAFTPFVHTWSLAVEEHFYLLLPLLLVGLMKLVNSASQNPFRHLPGIFIGLAIFCMAARILTARFIQPFDFFVHFFPTHLRMDSLMVGVLLAYLVRHHVDAMMKLERYRIPIFLACVASFIPPFIFDLSLHFWMFAIWPAALWLGSAGFVLLAFLASQKKSRSKNPLVRVLSWIGIYSYSIYLWHLHLAQSISHQIPARGWPGGVGPVALAYVLLAILVGACTYRLIEYPALAVRNRLFPRPQSPALPNP